MKKKWTLLVLWTMVFSGVSFAQAVSPDSIAVLKKEKEVLLVALSLNENRLALADMQNLLVEQTSKMQQTSDASQSAAGNNQEAANTLTTDPQDKQKAKNAKETASRAEKRAKEARKAKEKLDQLYKDIEEQNKKVYADQQRMAAFEVKMPMQ